MNRPNLKDVTLVCIDCVKYGSAIDAMQKSLEQIMPERAVFLTDVQFDVDGIETVIIPRINSKEEYSRFVIKELYKYYSTSHVLIIQWDGYVLDGNMWNNAFLKYDYIGSPWLEVDGMNVGNGGFSLRSKDLQLILGMDDTIVSFHPEDNQICRVYRPYLEANGCKFAPVELAEQFGYELREPNMPTFGFHGFFHSPYRPTIVLKRSGALGDIISMEPLMHELYLRYHNVVLDVPAHFFDVFSNHWYPVKHISQFDSGRISAQYVDLDMVYEVKPQQLHLKSYFEALNIIPKEYRNPKLIVGQQMKPLFNKYVVIHIDERDTLPRNVYGVDWYKIVDGLENIGYTVIQIGNQKHEVVGIEINTPTVGFLKWVIAGADYFIGIDSGPAQIAVACNVPSMIFFGSVDPQIIYPNLEGIDVVEVEDPCYNQKCWHLKTSTAGQECSVVGKGIQPPCTRFDTDVIIEILNSKL